MSINISFNFSESNSFLLDGKLENAQSLRHPLSSVVVSLLTDGRRVGTGCFLTKNMIITSNVNSKKLYESSVYTGKLRNVISETASAYFNGRLYIILDVLNINRILDASLLFDVALVKVGQ